jgi:hypothetical protein
VYAWNKEAVINTIPQRPNFGMPLFEINSAEIPLKPVKASECTLLEKLEKAYPIAEGKLDFLKVKKALETRIGKTSPEIQAKIFKGTWGALGRIIDQMDREK